MIQVGKSKLNKADVFLKVLLTKFSSTHINPKLLLRILILKNLNSAQIIEYDEEIHRRSHSKF